MAQPYAGNCICVNIISIIAHENHHRYNAVAVLLTEAHYVTYVMIYMHFMQSCKQFTRSGSDPSQSASSSVDLE